MDALTALERAGAVNPEKALREIDSLLIPSLKNDIQQALGLALSNTENAFDNLHQYLMRAQIPVRPRSSATPSEIDRELYEHESDHFRLPDTYPSREDPKATEKGPKKVEPGLWDVDDDIKK